jgi:murein DD-endopeptidase MepM/ murein hydrolase activator NlpD
MGEKMIFKKFTHPTLIVLGLALLFSLTIGGGKKLQDVSTVPQMASLADESDLIDQPPVDDVPDQLAVLNPEEPVDIPASEETDVEVLALLTDEEMEEDSTDVGGPREDGMGHNDFGELQLYQHVVKAGETISGIAKLYGTDPETIIANNGITNPNKIKVGDKLDVLTSPGVLHEVQKGESLWTISKFYGVSVSTITQANKVENPNNIKIGQVLFIPGGQAVAALRNLETLVSASGKLLANFSWPVSGRISSNYGMRWGRMHHGLDIAVPTGTEVKAAASGRVTYAGWNSGGYGYLVTIDHGDGVETRYAHNSKVLVSVGQQVKRGQVIALSGNTGNSTGPHVHFEVRFKGSSYNPKEYLR